MQLPKLIPILVVTLFCSIVWSDDTTKTIKLKDLELAIPSTWTQEEPESKQHIGQFKLPAAEGDKEDAQLTIFIANSALGTRREVSEFLGQFETGFKAKQKSGKWSKGIYSILEISGTYKKRQKTPMVAKNKNTRDGFKDPIKRVTKGDREKNWIPVPGQRYIHIRLIDRDAGIYGLQLTGPDKTTAMHANALRNSFGAQE